MRPQRPYVMASVRHGQGVEEVLAFIKTAGGLE